MLAPTTTNQLTTNDEQLLNKPIYLSAGANGKVYKIKDENTGELIALKELIVHPNYPHMEYAFRNEVCYIFD